MKKKHFILAAALLLVAIAIGAVCICSQKGVNIPATDKLHKATNAVYYWRTVYNPSDAELSFMKKHQVGRMYMRMFDVVENGEKPMPNATIKFGQPVPEGMEIVPSVFITVEAMEAAGANSSIDDLAARIVERVEHICSWNGIENWHEIQLDCDWTDGTRDMFFALCREVKARLPKGKLLSSTIRLHQLTEEAPPVDYGVLMVYNTDNFRNPEATNSILNDSTVEEYLERRIDFSLPLDVALPIYQWNLIFDKQGNFLRISSRYDYEEGTVRKFESVPFATLSRTQALLNKYLHLQRGHYSTVLYHLDETNINNYSDEQIESLYNN